MGVRFCSGGIRVGGVRGERVTVLRVGTRQGGLAPRVRAVKSSEFGKGKL